MKVVTIDDLRLRALIKSRDSTDCLSGRVKINAPKREAILERYHSTNSQHIFKLEKYLFSVYKISVVTVGTRIPMVGINVKFRRTQLRVSVSHNRKNG